MNQTVIPEGRGKAKAIETFLATGGGTVSRGSQRNPNYKYQKGALAGKTYAEAFAEGERRWQGASPSIKDKYARMGGNEGTLAPSEMAEYSEEQNRRNLEAGGDGNGGTGREPQPGVAYGSDTTTAKGKPFSESNLAQGTVATTPMPIKKPALNGAETEGPMTSQEKRMKQYSESRATRMAQHGYAPNGKTFSQNKAEEEAKKKKDALPASMKPGDSFVGPMPPGNSGASAAPGSDEARRIALEQNQGSGRYATADTGNGGMAAAVAMEEKNAKDAEFQKFAQGALHPDAFKLAQPQTQVEGGRVEPYKPVMAVDLRPKAPVQVPAPPVSPVAPAVSPPAPAAKTPRINSLTGLPMGYRPGDSVAGMGAGVEKAAVESNVRMGNAMGAAAKAGTLGKPFTGIGQSQTPASGYAGPKTRFTPGMGHVPVATPVTNGDEKISYGSYDEARTRKNSPGSTSGQDMKDVAVMTEFGRQQDARNAEEMRKKRLANPQARKAGSPNFSM